MNLGRPLQRCSLAVFVVTILLLFQNCGGEFASRTSDLSSLQSGKVSVFDFPSRSLSSSKKSELLQALGSGTFTPLRYFYLDLESVYEDFNINPDHIQSCDVRHELFAKTAERVVWANQYFCRAEFDTADCRANYFKKVRLDLCLDLDDSIDWVAIQAAILNAAGRSVVIPKGRTFLVNQTIILPSQTQLVWEGSGPAVTDRLVHRAPGSSFIRWVRKREPPLANGLGQNANFTIGSVIVGGDMPFVYSGSNPFRSPGITRNISLLYPMIDGADTPGENGISFAQGVEGALVYGGTIRTSNPNLP